MLVNKHEGVGLGKYNDCKTLIEYSDDMSNIYENIEEYNSDKERKVLIILVDVIADMLSNKKN